MEQSAVILVNVGTPDSPSVTDVRRYLSQFLNDRRVIDLPWLLQKALVNLIIVPFRAPKSAKLYEQLWTKNGSPLLYYSVQVAAKLQLRMGEGYHVYNAMRYGNPSLESVLKEIEYLKYRKIVVLPLFPQYASATTGSVFQFVLAQISRWNVIPELQLINHFHNHPAFIEAFAASAAQYEATDWDHVIFSFHGLPLRQLNKVHPGGVACNECLCKTHTIEAGRFCYQAACYETARLIAHKAGFSAKDYSVSFQSRLTKDWMSPFTDEVLVQKAQAGLKKILIFAPSFVADCLETTIEIEKEYSLLFRKHGGEHLQLVESLNDHDEWIEGLVQILKSNGCL